jgi:thymidylate kinase
LVEVVQRHGWRLVQSLQHEYCARYDVLMDPDQPGHYLKLDGCSDYVRVGYRFLSATLLLEGRRCYRTFFVPAPAAEFSYTLAKVFAKQKNPADYLARLRALADQEPELAQQRFAELFGADAGPLQEWFARPVEDWAALGTRLFARNRFGLRERLAEWRRRLSRVTRPTGLSLVFLGADGVGKSAVISRLQELLAPPFRRQVVGHFCPMLFRQKNTGIVTEPHKLPPRGTLASWVKVLYHFADHWLGYLFQQWPAKARSTCIIFDRHFDDLLIDPRRYRIQHSAWLVRVLRRLLPPRDRVYVLDAPPEVIRQRKTELAVEELERQRAALRQLAASDPRFVVVDATAPADAVARAIVRDVIEYLAARQRRRDRHL